jgi:2-iminobutanoate/2-iminopropanoate deaminase
MQDRRVVSMGPASNGHSPAIVAGGLVYVSGLVGTGEAAEPEPDLQAQTRHVLDRLSRVLEAAGSSLGQTVTVNVFLKRAAYFAKDPPVRTTVVADPIDGALVEISAIAVPQGASREVLHPAGWAKSPRPYSYIVRAGDLVFFAGLVSRRASDDKVVPGSIALQTKTILDNAGALLKAAGLTYADVVAARVFITDDSYFEAMNDAYRKYFDVEPPARATAVTGLVGAEAGVEISLIASSAEKQPIGPLISPTLPVSSAIRVGRRVFLSGVTGNTETNRDDAAAQTREALTRLGRTLTTAGVSFADVVDSTVYLPDLWQHAKVQQVYREFFPTDPPARTTIGANLISRSGQIEIVLTAVK